MRCTILIGVRRLTFPGEFDQAICLYKSDTGTLFTVSQKRETALALGNQIVDSRINEGVPERWRFRTISVQYLLVSTYRVYQRDYIICDPLNPLFTGQQNTVVIDGATWRVTGRHGEDMRGPMAQ